MNAPRQPHVHDFRYDGDDPYLICACGRRLDALTGNPVTSRAAEGAAAPAYREALATAIELAKVAARNWHLVRYPDHPHDLADDCTEPVFVRLFSALGATPVDPAVREPGHAAADLRSRLSGWFSGDPTLSFTTRKRREREVAEAISAIQSEVRVTVDAHTKGLEYTNARLRNAVYAEILDDAAVRESVDPEPRTEPETK